MITRAETIADYSPRWRPSRATCSGRATLPLGILISFIVMRGIGVNANIMSLGGIATAIGAIGGAVRLAGRYGYRLRRRNPHCSRGRRVKRDTMTDHEQALEPEGARYM